MNGAIAAASFCPCETVRSPGDIDRPEPVMGSHHQHDHGRRSASSVSRLRTALGLTVIYMVVEAAGGWYSNSLALLADAGHMLTDVAALTLTLAAIWFASRPATSEKTYGYYRIEILAAFVNGVVLVLISLWVIYEAIQRWTAPPEVRGEAMTLIAAGGFAVNVASAALLHSDRSHDLNIRGAWLHVMGDLLGSVVAMAAGIAILAFGWLWADPLGSVLISGIIIIGAWRLILESVNILLEAVPPHIGRAAVESEIMETNGVLGVHDLHIWTISSGLHALSVHISHLPSVPHAELLASIRDRLNEKFGIDHLTIQMESQDQETEAIYVCETGTRCFEPSDRASAKGTGR